MPLIKTPAEVLCKNWQLRDPGRNCFELLLWTEHADLIIFFFFCITQGICVVHNFKGTHGAPSKPKPEDPRGMPLMAFPRVESPLETLSAQVL